MPSSIKMRITIRNESDATLNLADSELDHGSWTSSDWEPPSTIPPGEMKGFQSEGGIVIEPTTGTEGRVKYNIVADGGGGELYVHWDSPLIESQYGNTFHVFAPPNWEVSHWGGQGHEAELTVRLRRTALRAVANFNPRGRGFVFINQWSHDLPVITFGFLWNKLFDSLPGPLSDLGISRLVDENWLPITNAGAGMCGGMVYAIMDYYAHHVLPPSQMLPPTSPDDELFRYVRDRLWDSFDVSGEGYRFLAYSSPAYPNGDEGFSQQVAGLAKGRSWVTYREEWPAIQDDIDANRLSPVGLIQTDNLAIGDNHQVLAYAYSKSGQKVTLFIYDPNEGQKETEYRFDVSATDGEVHIDRFVNGAPSPGDKRIWCFFKIHNYSPHQPPVGRPFDSVREALRATMPPASASSPPLPELNEAIRASGLQGSGSVGVWMRSL
jgi:hypothetical protein